MENCNARFPTPGENDVLPLERRSAAPPPLPVVPSGLPKAMPEVVRLAGEPEESFYRRIVYANGWNACLAAAPVPQANPNDEQQFQNRVQPWMMACFGEKIAADTIERNHRFLEEALELVQACGCTASEAHELVDYTFGRPVGEKSQEVGGVMVTLAALCLAQGLDMHAGGETELARVWTKVAQIRAKQAAKPQFGPLAEAAPSPENIAQAAPGEVRDAARDVLAERRRQISVEGWTPEHDDEHDDFSMAKAGAAYAIAAAANTCERAVLDSFGNGGITASIRRAWPDSWDFKWFKPKSRRQDLVRAAALLIAEIERIDRAASK